MPSVKVAEHGNSSVCVAMRCYTPLEFFRNRPRLLRLKTLTYSLLAFLDTRQCFGRRTFGWLLPSRLYAPSYRSGSVPYTRVCQTFSSRLYLPARSSLDTLWTSPSPCWLLPPSVRYLTLPILLVAGHLAVDVLHGLTCPTCLSTPVSGGRCCWPCRRFLCSHTLLSLCCRLSTPVTVSSEFVGGLV
jgi:hypothetical protein